MMKKTKVLLVGNGINNIASEYKWIDLVNDLIEFVGAKGHIRTSKKPFPLLYEEIVAHAVKEKGMRESQIKVYIADKIASFQPNKIHREIIKLELSNVLTTNYDYTIEMASGNIETKALQNDGAVKEGVYSLFRKNKLGKTQVWHIHGERNIPQSIALGYEHYSGYLQRMRNYVVMDSGVAYKRKFSPLFRRLKQGTVAFDSWVDFFFRSDLYIVGLTLDFIEMHLWWLLTYRAKQKYSQRLPIKNQITYFYPSQMRSAISDKLELLAAIDVVPKPVSLKKDNWGLYYREVLAEIRKA